MRKKIAAVIERIIMALLRLLRYAADETHYINGADTLPPPLTAEEEARVFQLIEAGDYSARDMLITHNLRLAAYIARKRWH